MSVGPICRTVTIPAVARCFPAVCLVTPSAVKVFAECLRGYAQEGLPAAISTASRVVERLAVVAPSQSTSVRTIYGSRRPSLQRFDHRVRAIAQSPSDA